MKIKENTVFCKYHPNFGASQKFNDKRWIRCNLGDRINIFKFWQTLITLATTSGVIFYGNAAIAQIVPDGTMGAESSIVTPNVNIKGLPSDRIDGGATRGANLFHSFREFNVREGRGAYFSNPTGIENIFSRVTGRNASNIDGKLGVLGNANLFLLNPNGILFGPNASLDLNGSFLGSTANSLKFGDGKEFSATNPTAPPLLSVLVPLGVQFNQGQPSAIANFGNLSAGKNLTLLGGTVASTGQLSAPEGQVAVAAVPGDSVVNVSASGQLQNIDTSSIATGEGSSLADLLVNKDAQSHPGLTVNNNGQVEVAGSDVSVKDGDVVVKDVTAQTATLTAHQNLTLVNSQIGTTEDLNLLAGDTVRIRDSVANPFVAQGGGKLLVQGRQGVDIFALNNPNSGLFSGGDLVLRSGNTVGGDAHYWAGGNFRIEQLDGSLGGLFSPYDPIIRARGNVSFDSYRGASLHIIAGGSVQIDDNVEIIGADLENGWTDSFNLSDGSPITINGRQQPTLDIRAGVRADAIGIPGRTPADPIPGIVNPTYGSEPTSANITIGRIITQPRGQVFLTNQYEANTLAEGSIEIGDRTRNLNLFSIDSLASPVTIDARGDVTVYQGIISGIRTGIGGDIKILSQAGNINIGTGITQTENPIRGSLLSLSNNGSGGNITLRAGGNINVAGDITSEVLGGDGNGGDITLISNFGEINSLGITIKSKSNDGDLNTNNGRAGNITIQALRDISFEASGDIRSSIEASSNSNEEGFTTIRLNSLEGSVFLNNTNLTTTNTGNGLAGDIRINGRNIEITDTGRGDNEGIQSRGVNGRIFIGIDEQNRVTTKNITLRNSRVDTQANVNSNSASEGIQISSTDSIDIINSTVSTSTSAIADGGNINIDTGSLSVTGGSQLEATVNTNSDIQEVQGGNININTTGSVFLNNSSELRVNTSGQGNAGSIDIKAANLSLFSNSGLIGDVDPDGNGTGASITLDIAGNILLDGSEGQAGSGESTRITVGVLAAGENGPRGTGNGGEINITADSFVLTNGAIIKNSTQGNGDAGPIKINADIVDISGSVSGSGLPSGLFTSTSTNNKAGNITVEAGRFRIADGAALSARSTGDGEGGTIRVNARSFEATNGGQLLTTTSGSGKAGDIIIDATDQVTISGSDPKYSSRIEKFPNPVDSRVANAIQEGSASGLFANTQNNSKGIGGNVEIKTRELQIRDGSQILVESKGSGRAGNIDIFANKIFLNNGKLSANTTQESGANINLKGKDNSAVGFIVLWNGSQIVANASNFATGGNININSRLLLGLPPNGQNVSRITADANQGSGGAINITAGIYGFKNARPEVTPSQLNSNNIENNNYIAASSETGLAGSVASIDQIADPNRGLIQLPEDLADSSNLIAQSCPVGGQQATSQFVITGRGGLPPNPASALSSGVLVGNPAAVSAEHTSPTPTSPVEAKGVSISANGEIILTANPSKLGSYSSWQRFTGCSAQ